MFKELKVLKSKIVSKISEDIKSGKANLVLDLRYTDVSHPHWHLNFRDGDVWGHYCFMSVDGFNVTLYEDKSVRGLSGLDPYENEGRGESITIAISYYDFDADVFDNLKVKVYGDYTEVTEEEPVEKVDDCNVFRLNDRMILDINKFCDELVYRRYN